MTTPHNDNEWKEEFDIKVPGYSMQDIDSPVKVPIMVQRQDAIDFIEKLLQQEREENYNEGYKQGSKDWSGEEHEFNG